MKLDEALLNYRLCFSKMLFCVDVAYLNASDALTAQVELLTE